MENISLLSWCPDREIVQAKWIPVQEYLADPQINPFNKRIVQAGLAEGGLNIEGVEADKSRGPYETLIS